ncbi:recombinase family protein [Paraburkholderia franconis]|uniref:recombinase family protein n=1 Tax=Paraburkholderia franconis TaxID=2654983 RepID=UPI002AB08489|nr:recombinase family protein [Paraburkholderia franconis]
MPQYFPAADRPQLNVLLRRIARDDLLVVLKLSALGCSARDVLATLTQCRSAQVSVRCVELGSADLTGHPEPQAVRTLRAVVQMEIATRCQRGRKSLQCAQESGRHTGRPASLSRTDRARVMRSLDKGLSVSEVARKFSTSRQTIMRIRDASSAPATAQR